MLLQVTIDKLRGLRLSGMVKALEQQLRDPDINSLSFEERLGLLVDSEATERDSKQTASRLRAAKPKLQACIEDVNLKETKGIDKSTLKELALCRWIRGHRNIQLSGPTGIGKTYIACSLINSACRAGYKAIYYRAQRLFHNVGVARADGSYTKLLENLSRINLLVIDDFGNSSITDEMSRDLLEIIDDRDNSSTIIASQLPLENWHQTFTNATLAGAILDRFVHRAYKFSLSGPSKENWMSKTPMKISRTLLITIGRFLMQNTRTSKDDQMHSCLITDLMKQVEVIKERGDDRIRCIWSLKLIAEIVEKLDKVDRLDGFLPLTLRPALMLTSEEAALVLHILQKHPELSGTVLFEKLNNYFNGRIDEYFPKK